MQKTYQQIISNLESAAAYWEGHALDNPDAAPAYLDYAHHLRVLAELERLKELDKLVSSGLARSIQGQNE